mgnify:CR=1 FL=1
MTLRFAASVAALLLAIATRRAPAQAIELCDDKGFGRPCYTVTRDIPDLRLAGINNRTSSFRIRNGGVWQVCAQPGYRGYCRTFDRSVENLDRTPLQDNISSVRWARNGGGWPGGGGGVLPPGGGGPPGAGDDRCDRLSAQAAIVLYTRLDFRGDCRGLANSDRDLGARGAGIRSLRINRGRWRICTLRDFRGVCEEVERDVGRLPPRFADRIRSVQRLAP